MQSCHKSYLKFLKQSNSMKIIMGIDPGVKTGVAIKNIQTGEWITMQTREILRVQNIVLQALQTHGVDQAGLIFEDARLRKYFGKTGRERLQGAGSVKRDSSIWQSFCELNGVAYCAVPPGKKIKNRIFFNKITGWTGSTSQHARDAAMLIDGITEKNLKLINFVKAKTS